MSRTSNLAEHGLDASLHAWISACAVSVVVGGLIGKAMVMGY